MSGSPLHRLVIGDDLSVPLEGNEGFRMHLGSSVQETVLFVGVEDGRYPNAFCPTGTAFLLHYDDDAYLVTARHVIEPFEGQPYLIRANGSDGEPRILWSEAEKWFYHPDENVDVAAIPLHLTGRKGFHQRYIPQSKILTKEMMKALMIDVGDICYTVGLFRYIHGDKKNLPLVYSGNIALFHESEIPIWNRELQRKEFIQGSLIQTAGIHGASGSPVLVRPAFSRSKVPPELTPLDKVLYPHSEAFLFGVFVSAWFLPPDEVMRKELGAKAEDSLPVGLGVVVQAHRIIELLEIEELRERRKTNKPMGAAEQVSLAGNVDKKHERDDGAAQSTDENSAHREHFMSLLDAAARKQQPDD